jgi:hypothetical protein
VIPTLGKAGRPRSKVIGQQDVATVLKAYDELKIGALSLEHVLRKRYELNVPHNKIHAILKGERKGIARASKAEAQEVGQIREGA